MRRWSRRRLVILIILLPLLAGGIWYYRWRSERALWAEIVEDFPRALSEVDVQPIRGLSTCRYEQACRVLERRWEMVSPRVEMGLRKAAREVWEDTGDRRRRSLNSTPAEQKEANRLLRQEKGAELILLYSSPDPESRECLKERMAVARYLGEWDPANSTPKYFAITTASQPELETEYRAVLAARQAIHGPGHRLTLVTKCSLALQYQAWHRYAEAETVMREAVEGLSKLPEPTANPEAEDWRDTCLETRAFLSALFHEQGKYTEEAEADAARVAWTIKYHGPDTATIRSAYLTLAITLTHARRWEAAAQNAQRVLEIKGTDASNKGPAEKARAREIIGECEKCAGEEKTGSAGAQPGRSGE